MEGNPLIRRGKVNWTLLPRGHEGKKTPLAQSVLSYETSPGVSQGGKRKNYLKERKGEMERRPSTTFPDERREQFYHRKTLSISPSGKGEEGY